MRLAICVTVWLAVVASWAVQAGADEHRAPQLTRRLGATISTKRHLGCRHLAEIPSLSKFAAAIVEVLEDADSKKLPPDDLQASVLKEMSLDDTGCVHEDEEIADAYDEAMEKLERKGVVKYNSSGTKVKLDELQVKEGGNRRSDPYGGGGNNKDKDDDDDDDKDDSKDKGESGGSKKDDDDSKDGGKDDDDKDDNDSPDYQLEVEDGTETDGTESGGTDGEAGTTDPTAGPDSDQDGVADAAEDAAGTDPNDPDSDRDGATDGQEAGAGTDGLDPDDTPDVDDQDMENVSDVLEEIMGTDPADPDTDKDGARYETTQAAFNILN